MAIPQILYLFVIIEANPPNTIGESMSEIEANIQFEKEYPRLFLNKDQFGNYTNETANIMWIAHLQCLLINGLLEY